MYSESCSHWGNSWRIKSSPVTERMSPPRRIHRGGLAWLLSQSFAPQWLWAIIPVRLKRQMKLRKAWWFPPGHGGNELEEMNYLLSTPALSGGYERFYSGLGISEVTFNLENLALVNPSHSPPSHLLKRSCSAANSSHSVIVPVNLQGATVQGCLAAAGLFAALGRGEHRWEPAVSERIFLTWRRFCQEWMQLLSHAQQGCGLWEGFLEEATGRKNAQNSRFA